MRKGIFEAPVITAVRFDKKGNCIPSRVQFAGKTLYADTIASESLVAFRAGEMYYWLEKNGRNWQLVSAT